MEFVGLPECRINLSQAAIYLALAPKSNAAYKAVDAALDDVQREGNQPPPPHLRDANYRGAKKLGPRARATSTRTRIGGWVEQQYLPDKLAGRRYFSPLRGVEMEMARRLREDKRRASVSSEDEKPPERGRPCVTSCISSSLSSSAPSCSCWAGGGPRE